MQVGDLRLRSVVDRSWLLPGEKIVADSMAGGGEGSRSKMLDSVEIEG